MCAKLINIFLNLIFTFFFQIINAVAFPFALYSFETVVSYLTFPSAGLFRQSTAFIFNSAYVYTFNENK